MESIHSHGHGHISEDMLSVEDAFARIQGAFTPLEAESKPILDSIGQVLASDVISPLNLPPMANSGMDGYAVLYSDTKDASKNHPIQLRVIATVPAGQVCDKTVVPGSAIRIMTGAPIPPGSDVVIPFEETDETERLKSHQHIDHISILSCLPQFSNIRPSGEDVKTGDVILKAGTIVRASEVGVLASLGFADINVIRRPLVAILSTGDELENLGDTLGPGHIYDSNSYSIAASVVSAGGIPKILGIARDNIDDMHLKLSLLSNSDLLITSAGVSKGDYDLVKDVLITQGDINFWSVRMRPAKPLAFGHLRRSGQPVIPLLGLPGNPVSAMVAFEMFGRTAIRTMLGKSRLLRPIVEGVLTAPIYNGDQRRVYARVEVIRNKGIYYASPTGPQGSNILSSMSRANGLAICPEDIKQKEAGATVQIIMTDWNEEVE